MSVNLRQVVDDVRSGQYEPTELRSADAPESGAGLLDEIRARLQTR
jgi:hypothetical protein